MCASAREGRKGRGERGGMKGRRIGGKGGRREWKGVRGGTMINML